MVYTIKEGHNYLETAGGIATPYKNEAEENHPYVLRRRRFRTPTEFWKPERKKARPEFKGSTIKRTNSKRWISKAPSSDSTVTLEPPSRKRTKVHSPVRGLKKRKLDESD
eukprot:TRINITY_DN12697_c0_g1_i1.p1 TRINITY_DN12697_c0_g1~~TRINITY_DN12697_c0_g1_i1.p1  ORF type:complete len:110 (-),score=14.33 TRINITY_DN12697_c0_g1_i1:81-410(-)